jgi:hypothetical protein
MNINWGAFGTVFLVSFGAGVIVIVLFSLGVASMTPRAAAGEGASTPRGPLSRWAAGLCFLACAAVLAYGLYIIVK